MNINSSSPLYSSNEHTFGELKWQSSVLNDNKPAALMPAIHFDNAQPSVPQYCAPEVYSNPYSSITPAKQVQTVAPAPQQQVNTAMIEHVPDNCVVEIQPCVPQRKIRGTGSYQCLFSFQRDAYHIVDKETLIQITQFAFAAVTRKDYDPMYGKETQIEVTLVSKAKGTISEKELRDDKKWLAFLNTLSHTQINLYPKQSHVAAELRNCADAMVEKIFFPYYGGWTRQEDCWCYYTNSEFRTHPERERIESFKEAHTSIPGNAAIVAERFIESLTGLKSKGLRAICILWLHASFLATLLREQGIIPSMVLTFSDLNAVQERFLRRVFSVSKHDDALSTASPPDEFSLTLASQKDQPLVFTDGSGTRNSIDNCSLLREAMERGEVSVTRGNATIACPVRTLPVMISGRGTNLLGVACSIPVEAVPEDFDNEMCTEIIAGEADHTTYWSSFVAYTAKCILELKDCLRNSRVLALQAASELDLPSAAADALAVMECAASFIRRFYEELSLPPDCMREAIDESWRPCFLAALEEGKDEYEAPEGLAEVFISAARTAIRDKRIPAYAIGSHFEQVPRCAVYFSDDSVCFDTKAFQAICHEFHINPSALRPELRDRGFLSGKMVNSRSFQHRISVRLSRSGNETVSVYSIKREHFEVLGEPSVLEVR